MTAPSIAGARPAAAPEVVALLDVAGALAVRARQQQWPFAGLSLERERVAALRLHGGTVAEMDLTTAVLAEPHWTDVVVRDCHFVCERITAPMFLRTRFERCHFDGGIFTGGTMGGVVFRDCTFVGVTLEGTTLDDVRFEGCRLHEITMTSVRLRTVTLVNVSMSACRATECDADGATIVQGELRNARLTASRWHTTTLDGWTAEGVEVSGGEIATMSAVGCTALNCGVDAVDITGLRIEVPARLRALVFSASTITGLLIRLARECDTLSVLRSMVRDLRIRDSALVDTALRETRIIAPARISNTSLDGLDLRDADVTDLTMRSGSLDGPVQMDGARITRWTLDEASIAPDFFVLGTASVFIGSDQRLRG